MGTHLDKPDVEVCFDAATDRAFLRLHLDLNIPRGHFIELAALMEAELFEEAEALLMQLRPDAHEFLDLFFRQELRGRSTQAVA